MRLRQGIFAFYKPRGISSHDFVNKVRFLSGERRVGHGGTLDPFASGVLVVGIGKEYTKQLGQVLLHTQKVYRARIYLGATSTTDDPEGDKTFWPVKTTPTRKEIQDALTAFQGEIMQAPPRFSALKIKGERAYELARQGREVNLEPRKVIIDEIKLLAYEFPTIELEVTCQSGVYIRALARDIGKALDTGGYCYQLERTRVGEYIIEKAMRLF